MESIMNILGLLQSIGAWHGDCRAGVVMVEALELKETTLVGRCTRSCRGSCLDDCATDRAS